MILTLNCLIKLTRFLKWGVCAKKFSKNAKRNKFWFFEINSGLKFWFLGNQNFCISELRKLVEGDIRVLHTLLEAFIHYFCQDSSVPSMAHTQIILSKKTQKFIKVESFSNSLKLNSRINVARRIFQKLNISFVSSVGSFDDFRRCVIE